MSDSPTRRTGDVRMKLAPSKLEELEQLAVLYGMPAATLAAFAVVEWMNGKANNLRLARMAVLETTRGMQAQVANVLNQIADDPEFQKMVVTAPSGLPLDGEAGTSGEA